MSSARRIQQQVQESNRERDAFWKTKIPDVLASRLIVRPDDTSYFDKVGVYSSTLWRRRFDEGTSEEILLKDYPGLTREDLKVCFVFETLRILRLL